VTFPLGVVLDPLVANSGSNLNSQPEPICNGFCIPTRSGYVNWPFISRSEFKTGWICNWIWICNRIQIYSFLHLLSWSQLRSELSVKQTQHLIRILNISHSSVNSILQLNGRPVMSDTIKPPQFTKRIVPVVPRAEIRPQKNSEGLEKSAI
jgi:hypothetical protein